MSMADFVQEDDTGRETDVVLACMELAVWWQGIVSLTNNTGP